MAKCNLGNLPMRSASAQLTVPRNNSCPKPAGNLTLYYIAAHDARHKSHRLTWVKFQRNPAIHASAGREPKIQAGKRHQVNALGAELRFIVTVP